VSEAIEIGDTVEAWPRGGGITEDGIYVVRNIDVVTNYHLESANIPGIFMYTVYCELVKKVCDHRDFFGTPWVEANKNTEVYSGSTSINFCPHCGERL